MLVDDDEANITHPFYLDMTKDCVIIFDNVVYHGQKSVLKNGNGPWLKL